MRSSSSFHSHSYPHLNFIYCLIGHSSSYSDLYTSRVTAAGASQHHNNTMWPMIVFLRETQNSRGWHYGHQQKNKYKRHSQYSFQITTPMIAPHKNQPLIDHPERSASWTRQDPSSVVPVPVPRDHHQSLSLYSN